MCCESEWENNQFLKLRKGVHQGKPISPLLFNIFINDIFEQLKSTQEISLDNKHTFNTLMYADDLIILSTSKENLQKDLSMVNEYCNKWKLQINYSKTKCMTFTKGTQKEKNIFTIDNYPIENVKKYKYLGITINAKNCSLNPTQIDLSCKATNAFYAINSNIPLKLMPIKTELKIFDACISPILLYGSEVWCTFLDNDYKKWELSPIEKVHT